jgi:protein gp37
VIEVRRDLWRLIEETPYLDWLLLTKRPQNIERMLPKNWGDGWHNVWLGVSIEDEKVVSRATLLRRIPATVHFISYEPALGPLAHVLDLTDIEWLIYGGESGPGFRGHDVQWARDIMAACTRSGTAFFYKQSPAIRTEMGIELDGNIVRRYPTRTLPIPTELLNVDASGQAELL